MISNLVDGLPCFQITNPESPYKFYKFLSTPMNVSSLMDLDYQNNYILKYKINTFKSQITPK